MLLVFVNNNINNKDITTDTHSDADTFPIDNSYSL